jgi:putative ABC transport system permease protein
MLYNDIDSENLIKEATYMLQLKKITKTYKTGEISQDALNEVSVNFRENEFVAVLGQSGSGKTTLLNIIGGLDRYDSGDLIINEKSTKEYKDADWDAYRNHSIGFVFQSYNLIPHQTVLSNVELALTLSGVPKAERRQRAKDVLDKVGLSDQLHKKPNQMSGGQMQRVAIARALVNNPDILLADEPTGALDSETSVQVIDLLKEIAKDRLIIMVTHNPDIAGQYANRIIHLRDGKITDDSNPYTDEMLAADAGKKAVLNESGKKTNKKDKTSMSYLTALSLSLNNLLTKKGRTFLTSFAGSIGIIGIALILSLSTGFQAYINSVQADTLSSYPLTIDSKNIDLSSLISAKKADSKVKVSHPAGKVYSDTQMVDTMNAISDLSWNNNLKDFKTYLDANGSKLQNDVNAVKFSYGVKINIYDKDTSKGPRQLNPSPLSGGDSGSSMLPASMSQSYDKWNELIDNSKLLSSQYDVLAGNWPRAYNEVVLIVDSNNEVDEYTWQALGVKNAMDYAKAMQSGEGYKATKVALTYNQILALNFRLVLPSGYYSLNQKSGKWIDMSGDKNYVKNLVASGTEIKVVGIVRPNAQSVATSSSGSSIGYLKSLTQYVIDQTNSSQIVKQQLKNPDVDVFTGLPFKAAPKVKTDTSTTTTEENTTLPAESTTAASNTSKTFSTPAAVNLQLNGNSPSASFMASTTTTAPATVTKAQVYAYIKAHYSGAEQKKMLTMADLFLKTTRTLSERQQLIDYLDEILAKQPIEGMGNITGQQAYTYILLMSEDTKLQMLSRIMEAGTKPVETTVPNTKPGTTNSTKTTNPQEPTTKAPVVVPVPTVSDSTLQDNLSLLGVADLANPSSIDIYPKSFAAKDHITQFITDYNTKMTSAGKPDNVIKYTDYIGLIMSSVTKIVNIVSYVLIAFVSISLVVSSIMIGIITYISVLERTKEIGILRSIGASKRDISRVFNAETLIVGFAAGILGIASTLLLCIPINIIIGKLTDITGVAKLPLAGGLALIAISVVLTTIAGLIPSKMAARKDPVIALRTE